MFSIIRTILALIVGGLLALGFMTGLSVPDRWRINPASYADKCGDPQWRELAETLTMPATYDWEWSAGRAQSDQLGIRIDTPNAADGQAFRVFYRAKGGDSSIVTGMAGSRPDPRSPWVRVPDRAFTGSCRALVGRSLAPMMPSIRLRDAIAGKSTQPEGWPTAVAPRRD